MFLTSLLLSATPLFLSPSPQNTREQVTAQYHKLAAAKDAPALAKLWKDNVGLVLQTIDADLEGSLALWENAPEAAPATEIKALQQRALFGAQVASEALGQPIFLDYTSSFVDWDASQKHAFRNGQQLYGRAMKDIKAEDFEHAYDAARETVERASALGDWWGTAMGYGAQGAAAQAMGNFEDGLLGFSMARQINNSLGLRSSEYRNLSGMLTCAVAMERRQRALSTAKDLAKMAEAFGDMATLKKTLHTQAELESQLGMKSASAATTKRLAGIGK
jgi:hypothetical protein